MKLLFSRPFSRKTFDTYNILRKYYHAEQFVLIHEKKSLLFELVCRLLYGKIELCNVSGHVDIFKHICEVHSGEKIVLLPLEESDILEYHKSSVNSDKSEILGLMPSESTIEICRNKLILSGFCAEKGIGVPKLFSIDQVETELLNTPIIAKPIIGSGSRGIKILKRQEDFHPGSYEKGNYIFQELIPNGEKIEGCFALCANGEILTSYCHRRIKTYPRSGGVTVYSKFNDNNSLNKITSQVVEQLNYSGLIMIEYLFDHRDNSYKLIEINPRLWGSVLLSEAIGTKMLRNYVNVSLGMTMDKVFQMKSDAGIRWLLPYGISFLGILEIFKKKTVFVNISYTSFHRALLFHIFVYFPRILKR